MADRYAITANFSTLPNICTFYCRKKNEALTLALFLSAHGVSTLTAGPNGIIDTKKAKASAQ